MKDKETLGPLELTGKLFHTTGTVVNVVDSAVTKTGDVIESSLNSVASLANASEQAVKITTSGWIEDMKIDSIIDSADRQVELHLAVKEANERLIKAGLEGNLTIENFKG